MPRHSKRVWKKLGHGKRPRRKHAATIRSINYSGIKYFKRTLNCSNMASAMFQTAQSGGTITQNLNTTGDIGLTNTSPNYKSFYSLSLGFRLQDLPDATEFTTLFDTYQIRKIVLTLTPYNTSSQFGASPTGFVGLLVHTVRDLDDNNTFAASDTGINEMREYASYKTINLCNTKKSIYKFVFTPRIAMAAYGGSVFTSYAQAKSNQWIDCQSADVVHYGQKFVFEMNCPSTNAYTAYFKMEATYYIGLKDVR